MWTRRALLAAAVVAAIELPLGARPRPRPRSHLGLPLPRGSKPVSDHLFESGRGFRKTVEFYRTQLRRLGLRHAAVPVYGYRGVTVARFLSRDRSAQWSALHIFSVAGRTQIFIVPLDETPGEV